MEQDGRISLDAMPCAFCQVRCDGPLSIVSANRLFYSLCGYTPEEAGSAGFTSLSFINYPADWPAFQAALREGGLSARRSFSADTKAVHRSGRVLWLQAHCSPAPCGEDLLNCVFLDTTEQMGLLEQLRRGDEERQLLLQHTGRFVFRYYIASRIIVFSPDAAAELGVPQRLQGAPNTPSIDERCAPESAADYIRFFNEMRTGLPSGNVVLHFRNHTGEYVWYSCAFSMVYGPDGVPQHAVISFEDVSAQREKELAYEKWSQYNQSQMRSALMYYECNLSRNLLDKIDGADALRFPPEALDSYDGLYRYVVDELLWPEDRAVYETYFRRSRLMEQFEDGKRELGMECRRKDPRGRPFWVLVTVQILPDPYSDDVKAFILVKNIDAEKRREMELQARSQQDPLTGCLNRAAFAEQADALFQAGPAGAVHALIMLDIDHFKYLNDTMGHQFGDQVLTGVAERLSKALRGQDLVGRLGGDEFVLLLRGLPAGLDLQERIDGLCQSLGRDWEGGAAITVSMGAAVCPRDGNTFDVLYRKADQALYHAKRQGRARAVLFEPEGPQDDSPGLATPIDPPQPTPALRADEAAMEMGRRLESACYRALLELSGAIVIEYESRTGSYYVSPSASRFAFFTNLGRNENHFFLTPECVHSYDWPLAQALSRAIRQGAPSAQACLHLLLNSGEYRRCQLALTILQGDSKDIYRSFVSIREAEPLP